MIDQRKELLNQRKSLERKMNVTVGGKELFAEEAIIPAADEQKLMDYSMELYMAVKNMAMLAEMKEKREKYDSLWDDEDENKTEYDPQGKVESAEIDMALPEGIEPVETEG